LWIRLLLSRLWRSYPWFTAYIFSLGLESGLLLAVVHQRVLYQRIWVVFRLIDAVLVAKVVLAIFGQWTSSFHGIGAFGRRLAVLIIAVSTAAVFFTFPVSWPNHAWDLVVKVAIVSSRAANIGFALFLLLTMIFFLKFGGPVAPNLRRHTWAMAAYLGATSASYFVLASWVWIGNTLLPTVTILALLFWIFALRPAGEIQPETAGNPELWEEAEEMNRQMQKLADAVTLTPRGGKRGK
jgi:hypothetical protein